MLEFVSIAVDNRHVLVYDMTMGKNGFYLKLSWIFLLLLGFAACKNRDTEIENKAESLKIYRLLIRHYYCDDEEKTVLINQFSLKITHPYFYEQLFYRIPKIDREALEDFIDKNHDASVIASDFPLDGRYRFLSFSHSENPEEHHRKLKNLKNRVGKLRSYSTKKMIEFSKVGFNKKANQAIVRYQIYGSTQSLFPDGCDTSDKDFITFGRTLLLEKKLGPSPHVWAIKNPHLEYHN